jgi:hypothetical protein
MQAKSSFFVLKLSTWPQLIAFHFGAFEVNPLVGRLTRCLVPPVGYEPLRWSPYSLLCACETGVGGKSVYLGSFAGTRLSCSFSPTVFRSLPIRGCDANAT